MRRRSPSVHDCQHAARKLLDIRRKTYEDSDDDAILIARYNLALCCVLGRQWKALANGRLDGRRSGGDEVAELVGCTNNKGPEGTRRQLHEVDAVK